MSRIKISRDQESKEGSEDEQQISMSNVSQIRSFFSTTARFVKNCARLAAPLDELLKKYAPWVCGDCQRALFLQMKSILEISAKLWQRKEKTEDMGYELM